VSGPPQIGPGLPDIDPDEPYVKFVMYECRTCHERSDWALDGDPGPSDWQFKHSQGSSRKHRDFYLWEMSRGTARQHWA